MKKGFYPILGMAIFATLVASLLGTTTVSMGLVMGLMVFALMVTSTLQAISRSHHRFRCCNWCCDLCGSHTCWSNCFWQNDS